MPENRAKPNVKECEIEIWATLNRRACFAARRLSEGIFRLNALSDFS